MFKVQFCRPYPNLKHQEVGNCDAFQFVMGFDIDPQGILWLPDNGYVNGYSNICPPKIFHLDCKTHKVVKVYFHSYSSHNWKVKSV